MKIKLGILVTILSLMLVGCSNEDTKKPEDNISSGNETQENIEKEEKENTEGKEEEKETTKEENQVTTKEENQVTTKEEDQVTIKEEDQVNAGKKEANEIFKAYTLDVNDTEKKIEFKDVEIKKDSTVEDKIKELCAFLEKEYFKDENAKIVFKSIDENNVATIDLVNKDAWNQHFQGSTGGMISQATIVETLLQRGYAGEWIDGLNVVVDGTNGEELFEHAPFIETFFRNK